MRDDELAAVVREMRAKVKVATNGLTCSAGLGPNFMVAKIASDVNKPDGQCAVPLHSVERLLGFLRPVPVRKVGGVGKVTERRDCANGGCASGASANGASASG